MTRLEDLIRANDELVARLRFTDAESRRAADAVERARYELEHREAHLKETAVLRETLAQRYRHLQDAISAERRLEARVRERFGEHGPFLGRRPTGGGVPSWEEPA